MADQIEQNEVSNAIDNDQESIDITNFNPN